MPNKLVPVMIIGAMKCGTSTLYNYLRRHPQICTARTKEPSYFCEVMGKPEYNQGSYEDLFIPDSPDQKFSLDASTCYSKYPGETGVPERIKNYGIHPYFIYIVRNPLERIRSHYNYMRADLKWREKINSPHLINTSMYFKQLEQYEKIFSRRNLLVLEFEDLTNDPNTCCEKVFQFIGADKIQVEKEAVAQVRNRTRPTNRKQIAIKNNLGKYSSYFPPFIKNTARQMLNIMFPKKQHQLSANQLTSIKESLYEDMQMLQKEYNINVRKWGF
jgi:hypothetical protein